MTGFGRFSLQTPLGLLTIEIQSVNRKHLEINIHSPKEFSRFEPEIRNLVSKKVYRGQVQVRILLEVDVDAVSLFLPSKSSLLQWKLAWEGLAEGLGLSKASVTLPFLMEHAPVFTQADKGKEEDLKYLQQALELALKDFQKMREKEGKALQKDLLSRIQILKKHVSQIEHLSISSIEAWKLRLAEKIGSLTIASDGVMKEIVLLADKLDVTEELTRLHSHFHHMEELLSDVQEKTGRKIDFLIQEIGREINTTGSKSADTAIIRLIIEMKSELEKIREQVQNLE